MMVARGCREGEQGLIVVGYRILVWEDGKVLEMGGGDGYKQCECTTTFC